MVTWDDFDRIWARTSPLTPYEFSDPNYSQGWNFVGSTPPARQMWDSIQKKNDEKFKYLRDNFGTPNIVTQASQMTDTDKVYVYIGSEAGWNNGHWYYYDEGTSSWADGGVYNSVAFITDTTLSIAGQPADAKAVGDALALKADLAGCTFTGNVTVGADFSVTGDTTLVDANVTDLTATNVNTTDIVVSGDATIGGNASVTGDISSANVTTSANGTIGGNLSVSGTTTLTGDVSASADLSVAGDSSLTNLSVSGTTALAGTSTAPTPSADDNSTKIATTEYVQTEIKPIETDVTINDKRITNIEKLLQGNLYDYQTDSDSAYTKSVPSGAMPYAGLEKVGGKTVVWNQLVGDQYRSENLSSKGITITTDGGKVTLQGTTTGSGNYYFINNSKLNVYKNHKYLVRGVNKMSVGEFRIRSDSLAVFYVRLYSAPLYGEATFTPTQDTSVNVYYNVSATGASVDCEFEIQIIDLTLAFGAGSEPTNEQFRAIFPADYYAYNEGTLLSAGVTEVVSKDSNNDTLQTYSIPAEVQALEGYGWSAGTVYNYVDFERKVFVQNVARVDISSLNSWDWASTNIGKRYYIEGYDDLAQEINIYLPHNNSVCANIVCEKYATTPYDSPSIISISYGFSDGVGDYLIAIYDNTYNSLADWKTAMNGVYLYYELATPQEIDISQYLTDDNLIQVESGGTLTFPNSNGDDYRLPVPSEETYMVDLQEAINNG